MYETNRQEKEPVVGGARPSNVTHVSSPRTTPASKRVWRGKQASKHVQLQRRVNLYRKTEFVVPGRLSSNIDELPLYTANLIGFRVPREPKICT